MLRFYFAYAYKRYAYKKLISHGILCDVYSLQKKTLNYELVFISNYITITSL